MGRKGRVILMVLWGRKNKNTEEGSREKKPGLIRRIWRKFRGIDWKNPLNRWRLLFALLFFTVAMFGVGYGAIAFTSTPSFCDNCHEMASESVTFQASAHNQIKCTQCHIEPGPVNLVKHKIHALKEVYYHVVGVPEQIVQTMPVKNENCVQCHSENRLVSATGDLIVNHEGHIKKAKIPCITCHAGVVHAKTAERGINTINDHDYWTKDNAEKLISKKYTSPNMGTCIDCHNKVNNGEEPWKDIAYSLPENTHGKHAEKKAEDGHSTQTATTEVHEEDKEHGATAHKEETQDIILQAIGKQKNDVELSMECSTCHQDVSTPKNHNVTKWDQNHGDVALKNLDKCMECHQDSKWIKKLPKENIVDLINAAKPEKYIPNIEVTKNHSRENKFCSTCHTDRPDGHVESDEWLTAHADKAKTDEDKAGCYVCHDREKPESSSENPKAPTDVYCEFCHRTGFKTDKKS
jgi:nitrate/TMAO reductase-like tetraheme cytochrome c subunit